MKSSKGTEELQRKLRKLNKKLVKLSDKRAKAYKKVDVMRDEIEDEFNTKERKLTAKIDHLQIDSANEASDPVAVAALRPSAWKGKGKKNKKTSTVAE